MRQWILSLVIQTTSGERALYTIPVYAESRDDMEISAKRHVKMMHSSCVEVETYKFEEKVPHDPSLIPRLNPLQKMRGSMVLRVDEPEYRDLEDFVERSYDGVEEVKADPLLDYYTQVELYHKDQVLNEIEQSEPMIQSATATFSFWEWLWKKLTGCVSCKGKRENKSKYQKLSQDENDDHLERELELMSADMNDFSR